MEARAIARKLRRGEPIDKAIVEVFQDTCGIGVSEADARRIAEVFNSDGEITPD